MQIKDVILIVLGIIITILIIAFSVTVSVKNAEIKRISTLNTELNTRIGAAEASMSLQNEIIEQFKVDIKTKQDEYNNSLKELELYYSNKISETYDNMTCNDILKAINNNQQEYLK